MNEFKKISQKENFNTYNSYMIRIEVLIHLRFVNKCLFFLINLFYHTIALHICITAMWTCSQQWAPHVATFVNIYWGMYKNTITEII